MYKRKFFRTVETGKQIVDIIIKDVGDIFRQTKKLKTK